MTISILHKPELLFVESENGWYTMEYSGNNVWTGCGIEVSTTVETGELNIELSSPNAPVKTIRLYWKHKIDKRLLVLGDHWERAYGDLEWRCLVPERILPWYFLTHDGTTANGYGVKTGPNAFCYWQMNGDGITFTADVRCGNAGVILGQRQLNVASIVMYEGKDGQSPFSAAQDFCRQMCEHPVMPLMSVYGGNNWYSSYGKSSHQDIIKESKFIASLSPSGQNKPFMVIDDGWQLTSGNGACNGGPWVGNFSFPAMEKLAKEMTQIGVRPGLWCRPLLVSQRVPDKWVRYGNPSGAGIFLDPSVPEVLEHISEFIAQMVSWGYELIKHDFTTFDLLGRWGFEMKSSPNRLPFTFQDRGKTTAEIILQLYRTIAKASGDALIIGCNTVSHLAAGLFEIQRTGDDTSGKAWERTRYMGINTLAYRMSQHGAFYSHDADCVGITRQVPWEMNRQWLKLLAGSGTPLFVSVDPDIVTKEQEAEIREAFALASQPLPPAEPLDWMETTCPSRWLLNGREASFAWNRESVDELTQKDNIWWK
jgi:alpha-galactosidase